MEVQSEDKMSKKEKQIMDELISKGAKIRDGKVAISWFTEESKNSEKMPDELWYTMLKLASKYGIGGILLGAGGVCSRVQDGLGAKVKIFHDLSMKIYLLFEEVDNQVRNTQDVIEKEESPLIQAVKSKLIN